MLFADPRRRRAVNLVAKNSLSPLLYAVHHNLPEMVKLLLQQGADPNISSSRKVSPLYLASQRGLTDIVSILLQHSAALQNSLFCVCLFYFVFVFPLGLLFPLTLCCVIRSEIARNGATMMAIQIDASNVDGETALIAASAKVRVI